MGAVLMIGMLILLYLSPSLQISFYLRELIHEGYKNELQ